MRADKSTLFVKRNRQRAVPRSDLEDSVPLFECPDLKIDHGFRIAFSLTGRNRGDVFDFKNAVPFIGEDALAFDAIVIEDEHPAVMKIAIDHIFLFIRQ